MKISEVVAQYVALRDQKAQLKKQSTEIQLEMDKIEVKLLAAFEKVGVDSVKTEYGTAYTSTRTSATVVDKEVFMDYVKERGEWALLEVRAAKLAVDQFKEIHGDIPPGVNWSESVVVNIRK